MNLSKLDHFTIVTTKPEATVHFYANILGLESRPDRRPVSDRPGTWMFLGDHPVVHVTFVEQPGFATTGALDHVAFAGHGFEAYCHHLRKLGVTFRAVESAHLGLAQIFLLDPNGVRIEINIRGER